jgi:hypothetical protein
MKRTITLCLRFLASPLVVVGLLAIMEIAEPTHTARYTQKLSIALAMYGIGSMIPYFLSDEILHRRFGEVSTDDGQYKVTFASKEAKETFDLVKSFLWVGLVAGFVLWFLNSLLPIRLSTSQPFLANWFWVTGVAYCLSTGALFVIVSVGPSTNPPPTRGVA